MGKVVEKLLGGGSNTVILRICVEVYQRCGKRLYSQDAVRRFEEIRA